MTYLDNAATTFPKPEAVYAALDRFARSDMANPGRAGHKMALRSEAVLDDGRLRLNRLINGAGPERIAFALNGTDALNMAIKGVVQKGDHVVTTALEHNSVSRPLEALAVAGVITLTRVDPDAGGTIEPDAIRRAMRPNTRLLAMTHASNVFGTVQPVAEVAAVAKEFGALTLIDAAQTVGVLPIDVRAWGIDLLAFPGHKGLFGPTGTGALYVAPGVKVGAWREGGTGGDSATPTQPTAYPYYLEGGTPNVLGVSGVVAGLKWLDAQPAGSLLDHELGLCRRLCDRLDALPAVKVFAHRDWTRRVPVVAFRAEGLAASELGAILDDSFEIAVRPGLHCAPYAHKALGSGEEGLVRVSPGPFNTPADIDRLADALGEILA